MNILAIPSLKPEIRNLRPETTYRSMAKTIRENGFYFSLLGCFVLFGGIYLVLSNKEDAIFYFSAHRTLLLNSAFRFITKLGEGPMYFMVAIAALAVRLRYTLAVVLTGLSVMGFSFGLKILFAIDRPAVFFAKQNLSEKLVLVQGVELHTGATSFPSGHSMSAFALYSLLALLLPSQKRYAIPLFLLAVLIAISRLYLVQHFWPDVYAGGIIGAGLALLWYVVLGHPAEVGEVWLDRPILPIFTKSKMA